MKEKIDFKKYVGKEVTLSTKSGILKGTIEGVAVSGFLIFNDGDRTFLVATSGVKNVAVEGGRR